MTEKYYHLVFAADANYRLPLRVAVLSAAANCPDGEEEETTIWVLHENIPNHEQDLVSDRVTSLVHRVNLKFIDCSYALNNLKQIADQRTHLTRAALFRLMAADILPDSINRVLYLDCDLIILNNLRPLLISSLSGHAFGASLDWIFPTMYTRWQYEGSTDKVTPNPLTPYFNSGVMLIDLEQWRDQNLINQVTSIIDRFPEETRMKDQDGLNILYKGDFYILNAQWNAQTAPFGSTNPEVVERGYAAMRNAELIAVANASIVHFTGGKPWSRGFRDPNAYLWWQCVSKYKALSLGEQLVLKTNRLRYFFTTAIKLLFRNTFSQKG